jgi:hypothetical protein
MYNAGYGFGNAAPNFNSPGPQQPGGQPGQQQQQQQVMYNQQQFAGMAPQGAFGPGANPQMMQGAPAGMMPNAGMPNMGPNGQSKSTRLPFTSVFSCWDLWPSTLKDLNNSCAAIA